MNSNPSQEKIILFVLQCGRKITPMEALNEFDCFRLGARIWNLRKQGHNIETEMVERNGKRFAKYSLIQP